MTLENTPAGSAGAPADPGAGSSTLPSAGSASLPAPAHTSPRDAILQGLTLGKDGKATIEEGHQAGGGDKPAAKTKSGEPDSEGAVRDDKGRFIGKVAPIPPASKPGAQGGHNDSGAGGAPKPATAAQVAAAYKFAGRDFPSQAAAEAEMKSLLGRVPVEQQRNAALVRQIGQLEGMVNRFLKERGQAPAPAAPAAPAEPAGPKPPESALDAINMDALRHLIRTDGPEVAMAYLAQAMDGFVKSKIEGVSKQFEQTLSEKLKDVEAFRTEQTRLSAAQQLYLTAMNHKNAQGQPAYPELRNAQHGEQIMSIWMELPEDLRDDPEGRGFHTAYLWWKDQNPGAAAAIASAGGAPPPRPEDLIRPGAADALASAAAVSHAGTGLLPSGNGSVIPPNGAAVPAAQADFLRQLVKPRERLRGWRSDEQ
jgi:hypothetical protein